MSLLLAPVVRARRLFSPRLEQVDPFVKGNPLAEARKLNRAGYASAAVALARMAVERRLHELIVIASMPVTPPRRQLGIGRACSTLVALNVVQRHEVRLIEKFADRASRIVHGVPTTRLHARKLIIEAAKLLRMVEKRGGAA